MLTDISKHFVIDDHNETRFDRTIEMPPPAYRHQEIIDEIVDEIYFFLKEKKRNYLFDNGGPIDTINRARSFQPDVILRDKKDNTIVYFAIEIELANTFFKYEKDKYNDKGKNYIGYKGEDGKPDHLGFTKSYFVYIYDKNLWYTWIRDDNFETKGYYQEIKKPSEQILCELIKIPLTQLVQSYIDENNNNTEAKENIKTKNAPTPTRK